ncbi:MAG: glycoside hydrolase family 97 protein [Muribaculum sp.]|nr:glycoside hydrolase family 97 protein [Muribaculum sp.]
MNHSVLLATIGAIALYPSSCFAEQHSLASPDGRLVVNIDDKSGTPSYSIDYDGKPFILPSRLGIVTNGTDLSTGLKLSEASPVAKINESYSLPNIKKRDISVDANRAVYTFSKDGKDVMAVTFHVSDNDVAFRYTVFPDRGTRCYVVEQETTSFNLPEGTTTFLCPQSKPMGGFARTTPSYETPYTVDDTMGKNGYGEGFSFPCLFRNGDNGWILISETGVDGSYCASRLLWDDAVKGYIIGYPQPGEMNGLGSVSPGISLPGDTPWRTITIGNSLAPIVETTIPFDVVSPKYEAGKAFEPSKGSWSWIMKMDPSCNFDEQKRYIDFSSEMGYETVLVDALWDTQIGYDKMEELARYGKSKGVDLYLWYNSNGYWNDAPQGPRGKMDNTPARREEMKWMQDNGIKGIKVDFFGGDKQEMMRIYEDILTDANDFGLQVIFHGCTLPRGWERMFPNYAASEAVLASENLHFSQGSCDAEAFNATIHPIVRNTVGSMDFGGSALNKYYNANNEPKGSKRMTSDVFALATAVLFQSAVQHFALAPNNLTDAPEWAMDFMRNVPTTWTDTKFIDGYPGKYVILARRNGDKWYITGVNAQDEPLTANIQLPMLAPEAEVTVYSDNKNLEGKKAVEKLNKKGELKVNIPTGGGVLIVGYAPLK